MMSLPTIGLPYHTPIYALFQSRFRDDVASDGTDLRGDDGNLGFQSRFRDDVASDARPGAGRDLQLRVPIPLPG